MPFPTVDNPVTSHPRFIEGRVHLPTDTYVAVPQMAWVLSVQSCHVTTLGACSNVATVEAESSPAQCAPEFWKYKLKSKYLDIGCALAIRQISDYNKINMGERNIFANISVFMQQRRKQFSFDKNDTSGVFNWKKGDEGTQCAVVHLRRANHPVTKFS
jgi:hypothetical protein